MNAGLPLLIAAVAAACFPLNAAQRIQLEHQDFSTHKLLQRVFPESSALQAECCTLELRALIRPIKKDGLESLDGQLHVYMLRSPWPPQLSNLYMLKEVYVCVCIYMHFYCYLFFFLTYPCLCVYVYIYIYMMQGCHTPPPPHPMVSPLACQVGSCFVWPCCFPHLVLFGLVPSPPVEWGFGLFGWPRPACGGQCVLQRFYRGMVGLLLLVSIVMSS